MCPTWRTDAPDLARRPEKHPRAAAASVGRIADLRIATRVIRATDETTETAEMAEMAEMAEIDTAQETFATVHLSVTEVVILETTIAVTTALLGETVNEVIVTGKTDGTSRRKTRKTKTRKRRKLPPLHQDKR